MGRRGGGVSRVGKDELTQRRGESGGVGERQGTSIKNGWPVKRLGDLSDLITKGTTPTSVGHAFVPKGINFVKVESISENGQFIESKLARITRECHNALRKSQLKSGDILFSIAGALGRTAFVTDDIIPANTNQALAIIRLKKSDDVSTEFVLKALSTGIVLEQIEKFKGGVAQLNLSLAQVQEFLIPLPPLPEQQRIVGILDKAFEGIATAKTNTEKNLQNARALFESHLQSVFTQRGKGWEEKTLEQIAITFGRGKSKHRPRNEKKLYGGKYPFIQTGDIRNADHFITEYSQTYSEAGLAQSKLWPKGTICITIAANIAETGILGFDACFPDSVIGVVANPKEADVGFVEYLLQSFKVRLQAKGKGSAQANINVGTFENERFPFPSVAEQKRIGSMLDVLHEENQRLATLYERKLAALEELKKSLLYQAFSGGL